MKPHRHAKQRKSRAMVARVLAYAIRPSGEAGPDVKALHQDFVVLRQMLAQPSLSMTHQKIARYLLPAPPPDGSRLNRMRSAMRANNRMGEQNEESDHGREYEASQPGPPAGGRAASKDFVSDVEPGREDGRNSQSEPGHHPQKLPHATEAGFIRRATAALPGQATGHREIGSDRAEARALSPDFSSDRATHTDSGAPVSTEIGCELRNQRLHMRDKFR